MLGEKALPKRGGWKASDEDDEQRIRTSRPGKYLSHSSLHTEAWPSQGRILEKESHRSFMRKTVPQESSVLCLAGERMSRQSRSWRKWDGGQGAGAFVVRASLLMRRVPGMTGV